MVEFGYCRFMLFFLRSIFKLDAKWQQNRDPDEGGREAAIGSCIPASAFVRAQRADMSRWMRSASGSGASCLHMD